MNIHRLLDVNDTVLFYYTYRLLIRTGTDTLVGKYDDVRTDRFTNPRQPCIADHLSFESFSHYGSTAVAAAIILNVGLRCDLV